MSPQPPNPAPNPSTLTTFSTLYTHLKTKHAAPVLAPPKPHSPTLSATISSLQLHPTLEAALHILNADLASAHFLVRHMQAPPAYEGMMLHAILHRVEGDYDNAEAWYGAVRGSGVFRAAWGEEEGVVEGFLRRLMKGDGERERLERESRREIEAVVGWCVDRFGTERWVDASQAWVRPDEKVRAIGQGMVTGDEGRRRF